MLLPAGCIPVAGRRSGDYVGEAEARSPWVSAVNFESNGCIHSPRAAAERGALSAEKLTTTTVEQHDIRDTNYYYMIFSVL
jgi:hypothetical protein